MNESGQRETPGGRNSKLDLLLKDVGGTTNISLTKIATSIVDKLATVSHEIIIFSTPKGKRV